MKVVVACDHAGFPLKKIAIETIRACGHEVVESETYNTDPVDYPDITEKACRMIQRGEVDRGVVLCGSGVGACIAANKLKGIRAGLCHDTYSGHQGVEHDNMNVLCLGGRIIGVEPAKEIIRAFLSVEFSTDERHRRRVGKVMKLEAEG